jgi:hypothetical protein
MQATHTYEFKIFSTNAKPPPQTISSMGTPPYTQPIHHSIQLNKLHNFHLLKVFDHNVQY